MNKIKCYYLIALGESETDMPVYYLVIGTYREMDDFCSELWSRGEDAEIDRVREATEEELVNYSNREDKNYPWVFESPIRIS